MMKIACVLLFSLFMIAARSQSLNVDSLRSELKTARQDTNKVILYRLLAGIVGNSNPVEAVEYGKAG